MRLTVKNSQLKFIYKVYFSNLLSNFALKGVTKTRVLLTLPPDIHKLEIYKVTGIKAPPLGLAWIAAVLEEKGHKVKIIDSPTLELGWSDWLREVKSWHPDVVGFSMLTPTAPKGYKAAKMLKEEMGEDLPIIAGGVHVTPMYEEALNNHIDVVVLGEGEQTTAELIEVVGRHGLNREKLREVKGLAFKDGSRTVVTGVRPFIEDLDSLPWPARHLLPMDKYTLLNKPIRLAHAMASRGCPYGCTYCITSYFWGRRVRFRSAKSVADEVEHLVDKYKVGQIVFTDDDLTVNRRFVYELVKELRSRGIDIPFSCGSRVDHVDKEYLEFLYKNGCNALYFGVESASQETIDRIGKKIRLDQTVRVFRWVREVGGFAAGSFILGFPWETIEDMKRTVDFAIKLQPNYAQFTVLTPYPGTPLYDYALKYNLIEDWNWEHYTTVKPVMRGFHFTMEKLGKMFTYAYRKFYLRKQFILEEIKSGRFKKIFKPVIMGALSWLKEKIL